MACAPYFGGVALGLNLCGVGFSQQGAGCQSIARIFGREHGAAKVRRIAPLRRPKRGGLRGRLAVGSQDWWASGSKFSPTYRPIAHHRRICVLAASAPSGPVQSNFAAAIRLDVGPPSPPMLTAPTIRAQGPNQAPLAPIPHPLATYFAAISRFSSRPFLACKKSAFRIA